MTNKEKGYIIAKARQVFCWSSEYRQVKKRVHVVTIGRVYYYRCEKCQERTKEIHVDHIDPVVPLSGWDGWDSYFNRLFCSIDNLQALCKPCHKAKTKQEAAVRKAIRENATAITDY